MSLNTFLLSTFAKNTRFGPDIQSMRLRYQTLSVIYIDLGISLILIIFDFVLWIALRLPTAFYASICFGLCSTIALILLRQDKAHLSCIMSMIAMITTNFIGSGFGKEPIVGIGGVLGCSVVNFFLAYSPQVYTASTGILLVLLVGVYVPGVNDIFQLTFSDEQSKQIIILLVTMSLVFIYVSAAFTLQKSVEINIWKIAHINYMRSDSLTKEVLQASRAKDVFVSSLSHEIRNPLNSVKGSIGYLLEVIKNPEHIKVLQNAKLGCEILLNLANNALDAAKLQADKMELSYSSASFTSILHKVFMINSETIRSKKIHLRAFIDNRLPEMIWIDPSRLLQTMMNLLSNALKFTPADGRITVHVVWCPSDTKSEDLIELEENILTPPVPVIATLEDLQFPQLDATYEFDSQESITRRSNLSSTRQFKTKSFPGIGLTAFELEPWSIDKYSPHTRSGRSNNRNGYLKVQVSDTGSGIAPEHIPRLFQMFTQAHRSVATMHGGTGLGLWICKQLCQKMGGEIKLYSELNRGTTFVFYIAVNNDEELIPHVRRPNTLKISPNVLIVDDYAHNRELHKLLVEKEGAQAILATDGTEAVEKFKAREEGFYSFIMMDVMMVEMSGFAAAKLIREWEREQNRQRKVDIYFVSGEYFNEEEVMRAFRVAGGTRDTAGIQCLRKPIDLEVIKTTVLSYKENAE